MLIRCCVVLAVSALAFVACAKGPNSAAASSPSPSPGASAVAVLKGPGEARVGDRTKCPVGGDEFVVTEASPKAQYEGKTYYFCCPHCSEKFKADPKKYLGTK